MPAALDRLFDWKWLPLAAWVVVSALFLFINRGSYSTYFDGSDLVRLEQFSRHTVAEHLVATVEPNPGPELDAPLGRLTFGLLSKIWRGSSTPYIVVSQAIHIANIGLLLLLGLKLGLGTRVVALALGVFGFHAGMADVFWTPGHLTEPLCGCLALLSILLWIVNRPLLSAVAYWLALQIDLDAIALPLALLLYAWLLARDRLPSLVPHLALMSYGFIQLCLQSDLRFRPGQIWSNLIFHADELLIVSTDHPNARLLIFLVPLVFVKNNHRFTYGLFWLLLLPLLIYAGPPGDHSIYVAITGVALFLSCLADELGESAEGLVAAIMVFTWLLFNVPEYIQRTKEYAKQAAVSRHYIERVFTYRGWPSDGRAVLVDGAPDTLGFAGVEAALRIEGLTIPVEPLSSDSGKRLLAQPALTMLDWSSGSRLDIATREPGSQAETMLYMESGIASLELGPGWLDREKGTRWTTGRASVSLRRPPWGDRLVLEVSIPKEQIKALGSIRLSIYCRGREEWNAEYRKSGIWSMTWKQLDDVPVDTTETYDLEVSPLWKWKGHDVGLNVGRFGYQNSQWK